MKFGFYSQMHDSSVTRVYADLLDELREQVVFCEQAGFEIAWADEHHFNFGLVNSPNPIIPGAMLAQHTSRIKIGLPVPLPNWHPLRLAEDVALLDHLSRGRVEVDMGRGVSPFDVANLNPQLGGLWPDPSRRFERDMQAASRAHYAEVVEILKKAWTEPFFSHKGPYYEFPQPGFPWQYASLGLTAEDPTAVEDGKIVKMCVDPKPYQKPHPPLRMLMTSEPSFEEGAQLGLMGWVWVQPPQRLRRRLELYRDVRGKREGREFRVGEDVGALRMAYVAPTYEEAKRDADRLFTPYMVRTTTRPQEYYLDEGQDMPSEFDWEFFRKQLLIIAGSPEQVAEQIHELDETCGLDFIGLWMEAGGLGHEKIMSSLDLFASNVAPQFAKNGD
jgi:alkanesulfonate monooxygenase SsuD/methylene tetrahydromethanopterin reductase-like flavin-dependent oxidoreductase (luciferase family)